MDLIRKNDAVQCPLKKNEDTFEEKKQKVMALSSASLQQHE